MKKAVIYLFALCFTACLKDKVVVQSEGTKLISIEHLNNSGSWEVNYFYDTNENLEKIEDLRSLGRRYEITYQNDKVQEIFTSRISDNKPIFRDSMLYNANGNLREIHNFSSNSGAELPLTYIYEFEYDNNERVSKKSTFFVKNETYFSVEKYFWSKKNITRVEHYYGEEKLGYEFFYVYDDKENYKKGLPTSIANPISWSDNNVIQSDLKDHLGLIDINCSPCKTSYKYNKDDYPVLINTNSERAMNLIYE